MGGNVLVDSNFFIDLLRAGEDPFERLAVHADDFEFLTCGVVKTEVLRGVIIKKAHQRLAALFDCMIYVPTVNPIWEHVARLAWELDRAGRFVHIPDLIIAASALAADAAVLTLDSDFARIPGLRTLRQLA